MLRGFYILSMYCLIGLRLILASLDVSRKLGEQKARTFKLLKDIGFGSIGAI